MPTGFDWPAIGAFRKQEPDPALRQLHMLQLYREINELPGSQVYASKLEEYKVGLNSFEDAYKGATTPPEKEAIRQNLLKWSESIPPLLRQGLASRFAESPFSATNQRREWYIKNNPEPVMTADPEKQPAMYAEQRFARERWRQRFLKGTEGIDYDPPNLISVNGEYYAVKGEDGAPKLVSAQVMNSSLRETAKGINTTAEYLIASGGYAPPTVQKFQVVEDGEVREMLATGRFDVIHQSMAWQKSDLGASPRGNRTFKLPPTEGEKADIEGALMHANAGVRPDPAKVSASTHLMYEEIVAAQREFKNKPEEYKTWLGEYLSNFSPNYTFVVQGEAEKKDPWLGLARMKLKGGQHAVRVPGKFEHIRFSDGKEGQLIVSRTSDAVFDSQGQLVGRGVDETLRQLMSITYEDFVGMPAPQEDGQPQPQPQPKEIELNTKVLPEDLTGQGSTAE